MIGGIFQRNPNRGDGGYTFSLKKSPGCFRFVTLPLEILDKKNFLYPWKFCKIVLQIWPWKFQGQKPRLMKIQQSFLHGNSVKLCNNILWSLLEIALLFQLNPGISTWYFFNTPRNSMSSTPMPGFLSLSLSIYYVY